MKTYGEHKFTPTEALILEVLAARYRLGETCWTFNSQNSVALDKLELKGLVTWKHGVTEHSALVWLTDEGKALMLSNKYIPDNEVGQAAKKPLKKIYKEAKAIKEKLQAKDSKNS